LPGADHLKRRAEAHDTGKRLVGASRDGQVTVDYTVLSGFFVQQRTDHGVHSL